MDKHNSVGSRSDQGPLAEASRAGADLGEPPSMFGRVRRAVLGPPRRLDEKGIFHKVSLVALLAWVGLGADGLSSSAYGPEEAFRTLGQHTSLAVGLALLMAATVIIISLGYSRIIAAFPHGGGGYVVATKLLGPRVGLVSGCALLIDYVLTITVSIAAAGDALFSFLPPHLAAWKLPMEVTFIAGLTLLNLRGVRESVMALAPVFFLFVLTHLILIGGGLIGHIPEMPETAREVRDGLSSGTSTLGIGGMILLLLHAFSLGGGTYTGIEAVSNGVPIMRHPQVRTAQRTMFYMAASLAFTATGLLVCYLLWNIEPVAGKTMNAVLVERLSQGIPYGGVFVILTLLSEGALLVVAAQAGFADGPRVLANMALDSWAPRRFAALSERLTTQNGILLMGGAALVALLYTHGDVRTIVVMYAINVFLTFSLSLGGMLLHTIRTRATNPRWGRNAILFGKGLAICLIILTITVIEKFGQGGWITLLATGTLVGLCVLVRRHYTRVADTLQRAFAGLDRIPTPPGPMPGPIDPQKPVAAILVTSYGGIGVHTTLNAFRSFPNHFRGVVFLSVGVIDSGGFKGEDSVDLLRVQTEDSLKRYQELAHALGVPATYRLRVGTDAIDEAEALCLETARDFPHATFIGGQVVFERETWITRLLHNQAAQAIQRRLQWAGLTMVILPARVR